jgi:hypothetical protein
MLGRKNIFLGIKQLKSSFGTGRARLGPQENTFLASVNILAVLGELPLGPRENIFYASITKAILLYWASSLRAPSMYIFRPFYPSEIS